MIEPEAIHLRFTEHEMVHQSRELKNDGGPAFVRVDPAVEQCDFLRREIVHYRGGHFETWFFDEHGRRIAEHIDDCRDWGE